MMPSAATPPLLAEATKLSPSTRPERLGRRATEADRSAPIGTDRVGHWRHEWKYLVPRFLRGGLTRDLATLMAPDSHVGANGSYIVRSLYLDSLDWTCAREKMEGVPRRRKLRIRTYRTDDQNVSTLKFEIKHRDGERIRKDTTLVDSDHYGGLRDALVPHRAAAVLREPLSPLLAAFFKDVHLFALWPMMIVQFRRQAWVLPSHDNCRVTVDDELLAWRSGDVLADRAVAGLPPGRQNFILEVKTPGWMPLCLDHVVRKYKLQRVPFSKYAHAVRQGPFDLNNGT